MPPTAPYISEPFPGSMKLISLLKRGQVPNLSCENEFYLHENKKSFSHQNCNIGLSLFGPTL